MSILEKIAKANLVGCGGGCFPTARKWQMVKEAKSKNKVKYVVMNASEGEPNVFKDAWLFVHQTEKVVLGLKLAIDFLSEDGSCVKGFVYINPDYYRKYGRKIRQTIAKIFPTQEYEKVPVELFMKPHNAGYIGGEETSLLNAIEGKKVVPRLRPPYPTTNGLWGCPTLVNNVETFYNIKLVDSGDYKGERLFSINGDCRKPGVFSFPGNWNIEKVLKSSKNYPLYKFFVQVGGGASGEVLNQSQLKVPARGAMSLTLHRLDKHKPLELIRKWVSFFVNESCGQCTPCREGNIRLLEILDSPEPDWSLFSELLDNLDQTSFCGLGCAVPVPIESYVRNVLSDRSDNNIKIENSIRRIICECFK